MSDFTTGLLLVMLAGVLAGGCSAPIKLMKRFSYEHWALVSSLTGMLALPWGVLLCSAETGKVIAGIPLAVLLKANFFSFAWGIANVLAGLCLIRIGFSLTIGLLIGVGLPIGVLVPMFFRGSGKFADAPSLFSSTGWFVLLGLLVMLAALALIARAGFGKEKARPSAAPGKNGFMIGFAMAVAAGILQVGLSFAFVYSQGPIGEALYANGAGELGTMAGLWALTLPGGALVNLAYPLWRLGRNRSWGQFVKAPAEILLGIAMGIMFMAFVISLGLGMRLMGALGASIGFGIYQALQVAGSQAVGWLDGEWRGVPSRPRRQMAGAMLLLLIAVGCFSAGKC